MTPTIRTLLSKHAALLLTLTIEFDAAVADVARSDAAAA